MVDSSSSRANKLVVHEQLSDVCVLLSTFSRTYRKCPNPPEMNRLQINGNGSENTAKHQKLYSGLLKEMKSSSGGADSLACSQHFEESYPFFTFEGLLKIPRHTFNCITSPATIHGTAGAAGQSINGAFFAKC